MKDIMFGQYVVSDSILNKTDARFKLFLLFFYITIVLFINNFVSLGIFGTFLILLIYNTRIQLSSIKKTLRFSLIFIFFAIISSIFKDNGQTEYINLFNLLSISAYGLRLALINSIKVIMVIVISILITRTTTPLEFVKAIDRISRGANRFKLINLREIGFIMVVTIKFIPIILDEAHKIIKAQKARGIELITGGLLARLKNYAKILGPLFVSTLRRAESLSMAIESRCYGGPNESTSLNELRFSVIDFKVLIISLLILISIIYFQY